MIKSSICIEFGKTYLVLTDAPLNAEKDYRQTMLSENKIWGIMGLNERNIDGEVRLYADITDKESFLHYLLYHKLDYCEAINFFRDLKKVGTELSRFLIEENNLILKPELIFRDVKSGEYSFLCIPSDNIKEQSSFKKLLEYLLNRLDEGDETFMTHMLLLYDATSDEGTPSAHIYEDLVQLKQKQEEVPDCFEEPETEPIKEKPVFRLSLREISLLSGFASGIALIIWAVFFCG